MASRLEINFNRLLNRCQTMAAEDRQGDWRLPKYVEALQNYLAEMRKSPSKPVQEVLAEYTKKVNFLHGLIEADKMPSVSAKAVATEFLSPTRSCIEGSMGTHDLQRLAVSKCQAKVKAELFGTPKHSVSEGRVRQRRDPAGGQSSTTSIDDILRQQNAEQERLVGGMLQLVQDLKTNAKVIGKIAKDDTTTLIESTQMSEANYSRLKVESGRLEAHVQRSCNWSVWLLLALVCITFIGTILFMKIFPKR